MCWIQLRGQYADKYGRTVPNGVSAYVTNNSSNTVDSSGRISLGRTINLVSGGEVQNSGYHYPDI